MKDTKLNRIYVAILVIFFNLMILIGFAILGYVLGTAVRMISQGLISL